jgi:hypothetical protein
MRAATRAVIVYDVASAEIRRIIHPDTDTQDFRSHLMPGEAMTFMPLRNRGILPDKHDLDRARDAVIKATGRLPPQSTMRI